MVEGKFQNLTEIHHNWRSLVLKQYVMQMFENKKQVSKHTPITYLKGKGREGERKKGKGKEGFQEEQH